MAQRGEKPIVIGLAGQRFERRVGFTPVQRLERAGAPVAPSLASLLGGRHALDAGQCLFPVCFGQRHAQTPFEHLLIRPARVQRVDRLDRTWIQVDRLKQCRAPPNRSQLLVRERIATAESLDQDLRAPPVARREPIEPPGQHLTRFGPVWQRI